MAKLLGGGKRSAQTFKLTARCHKPLRNTSLETRSIINYRSMSPMVSKFQHFPTVGSQDELGRRLRWRSRVPTEVLPCEKAATDSGTAVTQHPYPREFRKLPHGRTRKTHSEKYRGTQPTLPLSQLWTARRPSSRSMRSRTLIQRVLGSKQIGGVGSRQPTFGETTHLIDQPRKNNTSAKGCSRRSKKNLFRRRHGQGSAFAGSPASCATPNATAAQSKSALP
jgi:hypothetical protein